MDVEEHRAGDQNETSQTQKEIDSVNSYLGNDNISEGDDDEEEEEEENFDQKDTSESDIEDPAQDDEDGDNTDEESIVDEGGGDGDGDEGEVEEDKESDESSMSENDDQNEPVLEDEDPVTEESPKTSSSATGSQSVSPVDGQKRGRGRPKKVLKNSDILEALEESYDEKPKRSRKEVNYGSDNNDQGSEFEDEEEDEEDEEEEEEEEEERPSKRQRVGDSEGIRRSGRERKAPKKFEVVLPQKKKRKKRAGSSDSEARSDEDSDEDYSSHRKYSRTKRKKKEKRRDKFNIYKKSPTKVKRKQKKVVSEEEEDSAALTDESDNEYSRSWRKKMKKSKAKGQITAADYGGDKKSSRARKTTKYREEDTSHESDLASDVDTGDAGEVAVEEEDIETIEFVLDHRMGKVGATGNPTMFWAVQDHGDPNECPETKQDVSLEESGESAVEQQFLIKWKGWSHINNTWESQASIDGKKKGSQEVKGIRRLVNYQQKLSEFNSWKKRANPEDVEYQEIEIELGRQMLVSYTQIERIFSQRKNENNTNDYFVKWRNLPYLDATWEDESVIKSYYSEALAEYNARKKAKCNPRSYKESMKFFKKTFKPLKEQPSFIGSESLRLRDYQMDGLNFMLKAWHNGDSLILADEMGLGKTIQSISFLKYLFHVYPFKGPMLVVVPLSTMAAWQKEFATWAPEINTICYNGNTQSREIIRQFELENSSGELTFNALLTNFEMVCKDRKFFQDIVWSNIVVDEAHRLKNKDSLLYNVLITIDSYHRLLLTGTPLQNSLKELWCLLSYLQLAVDNIETWESFEAQYGTAEERAAGYVKLHSLLRPYIIRRMKKDVEKSLPPKVEQILRVDMTVRQKKVYKLVLTRNYEALARGKNQTSLINIMMQLRKTCNHVELLQDQEDNIVKPEDRLKQLIYGSGKLLLLDKLLLRFREKGDRVLVFSQMVSMLNLLEDYMQLKRFPYQRLDGGVSADRRKQAIAQFNDPTSKDFCFLLSTKAGGLGINLQTANRVVIFDSDWNPQNDLQAIARAHRIGQKEEVKIFRFVASSSVDEDIIQRAKKKMVLDHLVIQSMDTTGKTIINGKADEKKGSVPFDKTELNMILKFGAEDLFKSEDTEEQEKEVDLDAILESAEVREDEEAPQSEANKELLSAFKCTNIAFDDEEGEEEEEDRDQESPEPTFKDWSEIIPSAMVEQHMPKHGLDMYSDPEELFNPIAMRKKRRRIKKRLGLDEDESVPNSTSVSRDGSEEEGEAGESVDSDMSDGEREIMSKLKKKGYKSGSERKYSKKKVQCLECPKQFVERKALKQHMVKQHNKTDFKFSEENKIQQSDLAGQNVDPELLADLVTDSTVKKKRGPPVANTRCFPCNKSFQHRLGYKNHLKNRHGGTEPPENRDPANLALPDDRISCLICYKKFNSVPGMKGHIQNVHLGLNQTNKAKNDTEEEDNEDPAAVQQTGKTVTEVEAKQIERMYYMMRKYGCSFCPVRFNNKSKLQMHEKIHQKSKKPVICPYCEKSYSKRDKLKKHIERLHPGKPMPAPSSPQKKTPSPKRKPSTKAKKSAVTEENSPSKRVEIPSITLNGHTKWKCPECGSLFSYQKGAMRHYKDFHLGEKKKRQEKNNSKSEPDVKPEVPGEKEEEIESEEEIDDDEDGDEDDDVMEVEVKPKPRTYNCPVCGKVYNNANSLWAHKKAKHPGLNQIPSTTKVTAVSPVTAGSPVTAVTPVTAGKTSVTKGGKEYVCPVCSKNYASYMSLYMHKKTKHPSILPSGGSNPPTPSEVQALKLGGITPNGRRAKVHQCAKCQKKYADLKGLANHIERMHSKDEPQSPTPIKDTTAACPYCCNIYSRRDKLYEHIRKIHPGSEVPIITRSPKNKLPTTETKPVLVGEEGVEDEDDDTDSNSGSGFGAGKIFVTAVKGTQRVTPKGRGRYKEKDYSCPHCQKGYCDPVRLKDHITSKHEPINDPWRDVGPNTDIAIRNRTVAAGYEMFKVLGVYSTGLRMKAARYAPVGKDMWQLTEEISKKVMKHDILTVLNTLTKHNGIFQLDPSELETLKGLTHCTKLRSTLVIDSAEKTAENKEDDDSNEVANDEPEEEIEDMEDEQEFLKQNGFDHEIETYASENVEYEDEVIAEPVEDEDKVMVEPVEDEDEVMVEPVEDEDEVMVEPVFQEGEVEEPVTP